MARGKRCVSSSIHKEVAKLIHIVRYEISKSLVLPGTLDEIFNKISKQTVRETKVDYLNWKNSTYLGERKNERIWLLIQTKNNFWRALFILLKSFSRWDYKRLGLYFVFVCLYEYFKKSSDINLINFLNNEVMGCKKVNKVPWITQKTFIRYFGLKNDFFEKYYT